MLLNVARTMRRSAANGPAERFVVWLQGCGFACPGCWNPEMWAFEPREERDVEALAAEVLATEGIEGVTLTGGEPFVQAAALAPFARAVRARGLTVFVFTGYDLADLTAADHRALLAETDVLVAGRFVAGMRAEGLVWRGSSNQRVHFLSSRYGLADMEGAPEVEVYIGADGGVRLTGFPCPGLIAPQPAVTSLAALAGPAAF
jgi:anaerobic ribonucleoside-triphosphate reductase activating protein